MTTKLDVTKTKVRTRSSGSTGNRGVGEKRISPTWGLSKRGIRGVATGSVASSCSFDLEKELRKGGLESHRRTWVTDSWRRGERTLHGRAHGLRGSKVFNALQGGDEKEKK